MAGQRWPNLQTVVVAESWGPRHLHCGWPVLNRRWGILFDITDVVKDYEFIIKLDSKRFHTTLLILFSYKSWSCLSKRFQQQLIQYTNGRDVDEVSLLTLALFNFLFHLFEPAKSAIEFSVIVGKVIHSANTWMILMWSQSQEFLEEIKKWLLIVHILLFRFTQHRFITFDPKARSESLQDPGGSDSCLGMAVQWVCSVELNVFILFYLLDSCCPSDRERGNTQRHLPTRCWL